MYPGLVALDLPAGRRSILDPSWLTIFLYHLFKKTDVHSIGIYYTPMLWTLQEYEFKDMNSLRANLAGQLKEWVTKFKVTYEFMSSGLWICVCWPGYLNLFNYYMWISRLKCAVACTICGGPHLETLGIKLRWPGSHGKLFSWWAISLLLRSLLENGNRPGKMA